MHRTHHSRHARGALTLVIALVVSLCVGALGVAAQADDTTTPSSGQTSATDAQPSGPTTSGTTDPTQTATRGTSKLLVPGPVHANPDLVVWRRGLAGNVGVTANDTCPSSCTTTLVSRPVGWSVAITLTGVISMHVPVKATPGRYGITYRLTETNSNQSAVGTLTVAVTPDSYAAPSGVVFSHPYRKGYRYKIRDRILRTINSVPPGGRIQVASWSFASKAYYNALRAAKARRVTVQIVLAQRNTRSNSDYRTLTRLLGTRVTPTGNWVKKCVYSCRGRSGTMHSKIFLFSSSYRTPWVTLTGSANLTDFAVTNQWNQMNTVSANKPVYDEAVRIFNQMTADRQASPMYVESHYPALWTYYYPAKAAKPSTDFMMHALAPVSCRGAVNAGRNGRTIIKIAMYAWYQDRGTWLARRVRQLWQQGCQVQIVYAISSNPVKSILYSPSGRGRIPMRQILLANKSGTPIYYLHDKWVTINGHYGANRSATLSFQGSFNFSNLGFSSDENFQMLPGRAYYLRFSNDFGLLWKDRQARAPSPVSTIKNIQRTAPSSPTLGTGTYRYMEAD